MKKSFSALILVILLSGCTSLEAKNEYDVSFPKIAENNNVFEKSELAKRTLGEHIFNKLIENKKIEWDAYRTQITRYEIENYLPIL